ncbi:MAG: HAD-IIIA family hydrolase [Termitinemataceae bacterium]|nr:MAG: HAD-IIIA family hydrolase [Termitinemataceae bacterium]
MDIKTSEMTVVIEAGGRGTRIASIASDIPKPMISICGKSILEHQIENLKKNGLSKIILVIGYLGGVIQEYFGDGSKFGVEIDYYVETEPLGSAGALFKIREKTSRDFLVINGDIIFDVDFSSFIEFHKTKKAMCSLAAHPNSHPFDSSLLVTDDNQCVSAWLSKEDKREYYSNLVNAGLHILSHSLLDEAEKICDFSKKKIDLDREIIKPLLHTKKIFAYRTSEYIKDMGTPDRYHQVENDMQSGIIALRNLSCKQRAVFLDRDGTLNKERGFITSPDDLELIDGVSDAVKAINKKGLLCIVITNQPIIARGEASLSLLHLIHKKLETELGSQGAYIDAIYFCPHHPDSGFRGERPEYKIDCECRKPKPGMLLKAAKDFNIDLSASFMVGDSTKDAIAGSRAGCKSFLLKTEKNTELPQGAQWISSLGEFVLKYL